MAIVSQSFEAPAAIFDARGADDFILSSRCRVRTVAVDGVYLNGSGPAVSVNVTFYRGRATPRTVTADDSDASYRDADGTGSFVVTAAAKLGIGHGWVSVQANMDFSSGGEWGWLTNTTIRGRASQWENPDDGYGTGCTVYTTTTTCIAAGEGGDFSFAIN